MNRRKIAVSALVVVCLAAAFWFSAESSATAVWTSKAPLPNARYGSSVGTIDGKLYVATGCCVSFSFPFSRINDTDVYDPVTDTWSARAPIPLGVYDAGTGVIDGKLYVAGGGSGPLFGEDSQRLQVYDPATNTWTDKALLPFPQRTLAGAVHDGKLFVTGRFSGALWVYDPVADSWSTRPAPAIARWSTSMAAVNGKLYLMGGHDDSANPIASVEEYDPVSNTWSFRSPIPVGRTGGAIAVQNDLIYFMGGQLVYDGVGYPSVASVDIYDPVSDTWSAGPSLNIARTFLRAAVVNDTIYAIGGTSWPNVSIPPPNLLDTNEALTTNEPPTIDGASVTVTQNSTTNNQIATVSDAEDGASSPAVTVISSNPSGGVTISNIVNTGGVITADVTATSPIGTAAFTLEVTDSSGAAATSTLEVSVIYAFQGFFQPVDNLPLLNVATAGSSIPLKFSLSGDQGFGIFAPGYPASGAIPCDANEPGAEIEETVTAGGSSLSYNAATGQYSYTWKTNKAWKGTCRILVVRFIDGTDHYAKFRFK